MNKAYKALVATTTFVGVLGVSFLKVCLNNKKTKSSKRNNYDFSGSYGQNNHSSDPFEDSFDDGFIDGLLGQRASNYDCEYQLGYKMCSHFDDDD